MCVCVSVCVVEERERENQLTCLHLLLVEYACFVCVCDAAAVQYDEEEKAKKPILSGACHSWKFQTNVEEFL